MATAVLEQGEDAFRKIFRLYRKRSPPADLSEVLEFRPGEPRLRTVQVGGGGALSDQAAALVGLKPLRHWSAYHVDGFPGFLFIVNPFLPSWQHRWVRQCLKMYPRKPNMCNLDLHMGGTGDLWGSSHAQLRRKSSQRRGEKTLLEKLRWVTLGYQYNWDTKKYYKEQHSPFPVDLAELSRCVSLACGFPNFKAEAGILNYYHMDSSLGIHVDESELDHSSPLLSFRCRHSVPVWDYKSHACKRHAAQGHPSSHLEAIHKVLLTDPSSVLPALSEALSSILTPYLPAASLVLWDVHPRSPRVVVCSLASDCDCTCQGCGCQGCLVPQVSAGAEVQCRKEAHTSTCQSHSVPFSSCPPGSPMLHYKGLLSFGQSSIFLLGGLSRNVAPTPMMMHSGDIMVMSGASRLLYHAVPRILRHPGGGVLPPCLSVPPTSDNSSPLVELCSPHDWEVCEAYLRDSRINVTVRRVLEEGGSFSDNGDRTDKEETPEAGHQIEDGETQEERERPNA